MELGKRLWGATEYENRQTFKIEIAQKLLKGSHDDIYAAEILSTEPKCRPETILYHVQQSIEKSIKAVTIHLGQAILLTHDIDVLVADLSQDLTEGLPAGVGELTQYATIRRYLDGDELIEKSDLTESIKIAHVYIDWATQLIQK